MQRLRFISPMAKITEVTVAAVNDGLPLEHDKVYEVSEELADKLLENDGDWRRLSPPEEEQIQAEPTSTESERTLSAEDVQEAITTAISKKRSGSPVAAETEGGNE